MGRSRAKKIHLTVIEIKKGIITLIEPDGTIGFYRQRGLDKLTPIDENYLIQNEKLRSDWRTFKELPSNYKISYEDEEFCGKASPYFQFE